MIFIKKYDSYISINEAIALEVIKPFVKAWKTSGGESRYLDIFKNRFRIYLNLINVDSDVYRQVEKTLEDNGYYIVDYHANKAGKVGDKRSFNIGKLIQRFNIEIKGEYDVDKDKVVSDEYKVVISRHPYDIAGMSTGREWNSCMDLSKKSDSVLNDILHGSIVAYLIENQDNNIENPINRILIKPFIDDKGHTILAADAKVYFLDKEVVGFKATVEKWLELQQVMNPDTIYTLHPKLYDDGKKYLLNSNIIKEVKKKYKSFKIDIENIIVQGYDNMFGLLNAKGDVVIPVEYKEVAPCGKHYTVKTSSSKNALYDKTGKLLISHGNYYILSFSGAEDIYSIIINAKERLYNVVTGDQSFEYDNIEALISPLIARVKNGSQYGIISIETFEEVLPTEYIHIRYEDDDNTIHAQNRFYKSGVFDINGKVKLPLIYEYIERYFDTGFSILRKNGRYLLADTNYNIVVSDCDYAHCFNNRYYKIEKDNMHGLYDIISNKMVIPVEYNNIRLGHKTIWVQSEKLGKSGMFNPDTNEIDWNYEDRI
jgi:hypothetical protein